MCATNGKRHAVEVYGKANGINPFSHAFVWDDSYSRHRFTRFTNGTMLLEMVLHCGLTDQERAAIFPGKYDLGRQYDLAGDACSVPLVAEELYAEYPDRLGVNGTIPELRHTIRQIEKVTKGFTFEQFRERDRAAAAKVLKLCWKLKASRSATLLSMILSPEDDRSGSLELSNPYPLGVDGDQKKRQLFADFKAHLSAEIAPDRLREINATFGAVRDALDTFVHRVNTALKTAPNADGTDASVQDVCDRFKVVRQAWLKPSSYQIKPLLLPLDEHLFIHMLVLDLRHLAAVDRDLHQNRIGQVAVSVVREELQRMPGKFSVENLSKAAPGVLSLAPILAKALGEAVDQDKFIANLPLAAHCLRHYLALSSIPPAINADPQTTAAAILFAMAINGPDRKPYKPRLQGQQAISGSIRAVMEQPVNAAHEEYERVCRYAMDWYRYALWGCEEMYEQQQAFAMGMVERVLSVCETNDTKRIQTLLDNFVEYAELGVHHVPTQVHAARQSQSLASQAVP
jgi:hypothetical protein